jgi:hypothetical protein
MVFFQNMEEWISKQPNRTFKVLKVDKELDVRFDDDFKIKNRFCYIPHQILKPAVKKLVKMINDEER